MIDSFGSRRSMPASAISAADVQVRRRSRSARGSCRCRRCGLGLTERAVPAIAKSDQVGEGVVRARVPYPRHLDERRRRRGLARPAAPDPRRRDSDRPPAAFAHRWGRTPRGPRSTATPARSRSGSPGSPASACGRGQPVRIVAGAMAGFGPGVGEPARREAACSAAVGRALKSPTITFGSSAADVDRLRDGRRLEEPVGRGRVQVGVVEPQRHAAHVDHARASSHAARSRPFRGSSVLLQVRIGNGSGSSVPYWCGRSAWLPAGAPGSPRSRSAASRGPPTARPARPGSRCAPRTGRSPAGRRCPGLCSRITPIAACRSRLQSGAGGCPGVAAGCVQSALV